MDARKESSSRNGRTVADLMIEGMNCCLLCCNPQKGTNFRWANSERDASFLRGQFTKGQYTKIYGRAGSKYKYHPQQQFENAVRKFDVVEALRAQMQQNGNQAFYRALLEANDMPQVRNYAADLTRITDLNTVSTSADYVYREVCSRKGKEAAQAARTSFARGFSRVVNVTDYEDWTRLRTELRTGKHHGARNEDTSEDRVILIALSYKGAWRDHQVSEPVRSVDADLQHKRCLVVDLARFSTVRHGHVVAVAEGTGLWAGNILPRHRVFVPNPDRDQTATIDGSGVVYTYQQMEIKMKSFLPFPRSGCCESREWPWVDSCDVGEAVFDNLLLHALYASGVKKQYRNLGGEFRDIRWK
ncbi:hypothetical protein FGB62_80g03 [Gracilaria domingensis]|nr:hypothetical protein FGB62_80g03 [Gracilaria domingensis]